MKEYLFNNLMDKTLDRFLAEYLRGPRNKEAVLHMPEMDDRIQDDLSRIYDFFSEYFDHERMSESFMPIDALRLFITAPPEQMAEEFIQLRNGFPDTPNWLPEKILAKRDDIEKAQAKEIMDTIKKTVGKPSEEITTVFGRMKKK
ncbi:exocyst complex component Sec6 [Syncephalis fuscata]|nr:exocyst complex component Sec6 [Syncephalis fuscata]